MFFEGSRQFFFRVARNVVDLDPFGSGPFGQVGSGSGIIVPDLDPDTNPDLTFSIRKSV